MNKEIKLADNEQLDDLLIENRKIIQRVDKYKFTSDAVRLSKFIDLKKTDKVCELCSGSGIISILLNIYNKKCSFTCVEIDKDMAELNQKNVDLNSFCDTIKITNNRLQEIHKTIGREIYDVVICNPPYFKPNKKTNDNDIAKFEIEVKLIDISIEANKLLKFNGSLYMVLPASRIFEMNEYLINYNFEIKKATFVKDKSKDEFKTVLIKATKGAKKGCLVNCLNV